MQPHSLATVEIRNDKTRAQRLAESGWAGRHGLHWPKGTVLPETPHTLVCPRVKVADLPEGHLPIRYLEALEHNQQIASCCRHPENHEIEAFKSHPDEPAPDIYILHCTCGRKHRRFCVGQTDTRPMWNAS